MAWSRSEKLDLVGVGLVVVLVAFVAMVAFGVFTATSGSSGDDVPDAEWNVEQLNDTAVEIEHAGGDPIRPENLVVTVDGLDRTGMFDGTAYPGDTATIRVTDASRIQIWWSGPHGSDTLMHSERL